MPPCALNECRVATHIIAGLYPLNFSKFLIKAYQPLVDDERKELMDIQNLYFTYLIQKLCDDNTKKINPVHAMDLLWNVDDSDYALLCDIGSAFAECYLTDSPIPIAETIDSCFLADGFDIELNLYWLECIYISKSNDHSLLVSKADSDSESDSRDDGDLLNDAKANDLREMHFQMDRLFLGKTAYKRRSMLKEEGVITSPVTKIFENEMPKTVPVSLSSPSSSSSLSSASVTVPPSPKRQPPQLKLQQPLPQSPQQQTCTDKLDSTKSLPKEFKHFVKEGGKLESPKGDRLAEALKLAVNQKLNL